MSKALGAGDEDNRETLCQDYVIKHTHEKKLLVTQSSYTPTNKTVFGCQSPSGDWSLQAEFTSL